MHILLVQYELYLPECHSLKEKRSVLKKLLNELRRDFNVSAAEVDYHDVWQSALIAVVCVSGLRRACERIERQITDLLERHESAQVAGMNTQWL